MIPFESVTFTYINLVSMLTYITFSYEIFGLGAFIFIGTQAFVEETIWFSGQDFTQVP